MSVLGRNQSGSTPSYSRLLAVLFVSVVAFECQPHVWAQQPPVYFDIQAGASTKAQVELRLGEAVRRVSQKEPIYEYPPAREDSDSIRLIITFDSDTLQVARLDAYLRTPLSADLLRSKLGTRVASQDRADGGRDEFYFPQLQALILADKSQSAKAAAVSFVSPRTLGWLYVRRFEEALRRNAYEDAQTEADKAVAVDSAGGEGYHAQGRLLVTLKEYDEAIVRFTAASNARYGQTDRYQAHLWIADVYARYKNAPDKARAAYLQAIEAAPALSRSEANLRFGQFLMTQKKTDEARASFVKAVNLDSESLDARHALGDSLYAAQDYAGALPHYEALSRRADSSPGDSRDALAYYRYAYALNRAGNKDLARQSYEKSLALDPKQSRALNNLGLIHVSNGAPLKAIELYRKATALDPREPLIYRNLAEALRLAGQLEDARREADHALSLKTDDAESMFTLAKCWGALKKKKETLQWLERAVTAGFGNRQAMTSDPSLAFVQNDGTFKKILLGVTGTP